MKLQRFRVKGFRSLKDVDWVQIIKLGVFTGQNDGGKTSMLEALSIFLNSKSQPDQDDYTKDASGQATTLVIMLGDFQLNEDERTTLDVQRARITIKREYSSDSVSGYLYETMVHPDIRLQRDLRSLRNDELLALADEHSIHLTNRRTKDSIVQEMGQWIQQQSLQPGWRALPSALTDGFPELRLFKSADALDPEEQINLALKASFVLRIRSEAYSGRINQVVEEIEREMTRDLSIFLPILQRYCSDITEMDIRPTFDFSNGFKTSKLMLKKASGALVDLSKEGQGRRRRITLAVYEWNEKLIATESEIQSFEQLIVAFDEPDTHLDYTQQRKIFDIIKRIAAQDNTNVIVCTHSLNLIDRIPITDIVHFQLEDNFTKISTIATDDPELTDIFLYQISETMGLRNSALLNERCFIIVEGPTELYALPVLFKLKFGYPPQAAGVRILFGEGGIGARLFAKFLNDIHRNVIFLVDQDITMSPHQRYFTRETLEEDGIDLDTQVHFVGTREFEDAFPNEIYMRAAQTFWPKADGTQWQISDFQQLRSGSDFSDGLMAMIRRNTRTNISKPQVGLHIAKSIRNLEEIPPPILRCLEHAGELAVTE